MRSTESERIAQGGEEVGGRRSSRPLPTRLDDLKTQGAGTSARLASLGKVPRCGAQGGAHGYAPA